ncbi:stromal interaction molecule homolog isoform X2 [Homalodisca vitripennis]|uniref:stromal interaction molecule homolog isoform X2 n=1 Tax=Homalodisca vitripennis TaxID=197043 RepID=UPI001EEC82A1|nr:stromal interaction molecule homolog isoform X2 [Homalodisca vitripennis]
MLISRTAVFLVFIVINACGQQSDVKEPQSGDSSVKKEQPNLDKSSVKIGSSGFSEFKGSGESQCNDDLACLTMASMDRHGLEAIRSLHRQLDDDANGAVDLSESDEFLREELQYENGAEKRQRAFHRNDDMHISVKELWEAWVRSEVHNWTVEQTTEWLASSVELPQYVPIFIMHRVTGATLPRLAVSNMQYLSNVLGIKDPIHKQKIALKAMDVVLFGPPKDYTNYLKDLILVTLLLGALIGCWYAYRQNKNSRRHLRRMMKDMESLHKAELALENLQKELESAKQEKECATTEKQDLERRLQEQREDAGELRTSYSDLEVSQLKAEIEMLRNELQRAEGELKDCCWAPPPGLQQWLQLTHEIENKAYIKKKINAEKQLQQAREACEKLRKKRSSLIGAFASTHGKSIDDVDRSIVEARTSLNEVTQELAERCHRWKQIELLLGFNIINNSGLAVLESLLYRNQANGRGAGLRSRMSSSQDDLDDDTSSYSPTAVRDWLVKSDMAVADRGGVESQGWKESESESEKQEDDEILTSRSAANVQFTIGSELEEVVPPKLPQYARSDSGRSSARIPRWQSQDIEPLGADREATTVGPKMSASETNLEAQAIAPPRMRRTARRMDRDPSVTQSIDDDPAYSTDSNSTAAEDSDKLKSKKHKISFPKFSRKSRQTPPPSLQPLPKTTYGCSNYLCQELLEM